MHEIFELLHLLNMANWPLWAQVPGAIIAIYGLWKFFITAPVWAPYV